MAEIMTRSSSLPASRRRLCDGVGHGVVTGSRWSRLLERASSVCCRLRRVVNPRAEEASAVNAVVLPVGWSWVVMQPPGKTVYQVTCPERALVRS